MRYYEYLSETKVNMLYPQIAQTSRTTGHELGFDLKVVKGTRKVDRHGEPSIYEKLAAVEEWIYAHEPVGGPGELTPWIYGRVSLSSLVYQPSTRHLPNVESAVLFAAIRFGNRSADALLMGGSARHLITARTENEQLQDGGRGEVVLSPSGSARLAVVLRMYCEELGLEYPYRPSDSPDRMAPSIWAPAFQICSGEGTELGVCEFLAKRIATAPPLDHRNLPHPSGTLATPLFVALAD